MKSIILASQSVQRKKLMDMLGVPYKVIPSGVDEHDTIVTSCARLVKHNALLKARDVAEKVKEGVVIGCDTVVFVDGKQLVLKPHDLKEAKKNLKKLFKKPQWVYSGLALVDAGTGKTLEGYERTKVFMHPLSDREIDTYHKKVPPLDKAGGFDIEGVGSIFIHRIEGCYTNVIGLPMAKLRLMLKKMGVSLLALLMTTLFLVGCTTEYNLAKGEQRTYMYGTEKEVSIGQSVAAKIESSQDIVTAVDVNEKVNRILDRLVEVSDRKDIVYFIRIIDQEHINAFALPGGYIFLYQGLIDHAENDDQIAGVIAHEIAHITARHGIERLQKSYAAMLLQGASLATGSGQVAAGVNLALNSLMMEYSQQDEMEADRLGVKYMTAAGFDPQAMIGFLNIMKKESDKEIRQFSYWKTHPYVPQRIAIIRKEISGALEFQDYIKLIGTEKKF